MFSMKEMLVVLTGLTALALHGVSPVRAQTHVKVGIISPTFGHAPFYVARGKGFFRKEGLVGEVIVMNRDELIIQALVSDSIQKGFSNLGDAFKLVPEYQLSAVWIKDEWVKKNRDVTVRFVRAFHLHQGAQIWPRDGKVDPKGVQIVIDLMAEEGQLKKPYLKPEEVIDHSYLLEVTGR